jgi:hypothetical protein
MKGEERKAKQGKEKENQGRNKIENNKDESKGTNKCTNNEYGKDKQKITAESGQKENGGTERSKRICGTVILLEHLML